MTTDLTKPSSTKRSVAQFSVDLTAIGVLVLEDIAKLSRPVAEQAMKRMVEDFVASYARCHIYVPTSFDRRDRTIFEKYHRQGRGARACTSDRIHELAGEYNLTTRRIYEIVEQCRKSGMQPHRHPAAELPAGGS